MNIFKLKHGERVNFFYENTNRTVADFNSIFVDKIAEDDSQKVIIGDVQKINTYVYRNVEVNGKKYLKRFSLLLGNDFARESYYKYSGKKSVKLLKENEEHIFVSLTEAAEFLKEPKYKVGRKLKSGKPIQGYLIKRI
jgi:hypothetical protein